MFVLNKKQLIQELQNTITRIENTNTELFATRLSIEYLTNRELDHDAILETYADIWNQYEYSVILDNSYHTQDLDSVYPHDDEDGVSRFLEAV